MRMTIVHGVPRILLRLSAFLCLTVAAGWGERVEAGPLTLRTSLKADKVCQGADRLGVILEIKNKSKKPVTFPLTELGYSLRYAIRETMHRPGAHPLNSALLGSIPLSSEVVTLAPGESRRLEVSIKFPSNAIVIDEPFEFRALLIADPGKKKSGENKVFKGTVESDRIRFAYVDCFAPGK